MSSGSGYRFTVPTTVSREIVEHVRTVHDFVGIRTVEISEESLNGIDVVCLCGSAVIQTVEVAAAVAEILPESVIVVTGGFGHSTSSLHDAVASSKRNLVSLAGVEPSDLCEAEVFERMLKFYGIKQERILCETHSTNCGANAENSAKLLEDKLPKVRGILVIQDPTMTRRSQLSFEKYFTKDRFPDLKRLEAYTLSFEEHTEALPYSFEHYVTLLCGEIVRLRDDEHGYGPNGAGFIGHCDIPAEVMASLETLKKSIDVKSRLL